MKWMVVATAPNQPLAEAWRELLQQEDIPCLVKTVAGLPTMVVGVSGQPCSLLVPEGLKEEARAVLAGIAGEASPFEIP